MKIKLLLFFAIAFSVKVAAQSRTQLIAEISSVMASSKGLKITLDNDQGKVDYQHLNIVDYATYRNKTEVVISEVLSWGKKYENLYTDYTFNTADYFAIFYGEIENKKLDNKGFSVTINVQGDGVKVRTRQGDNDTTQYVKNIEIYVKKQGKDGKDNLNKLTDLFRKLKSLSE